LVLRASTLAVKTALKVSGDQFEPNYIASASASGTSRHVRFRQCRLLPDLDAERPNDATELSITDLTVKVKSTVGSGGQIMVGKSSSPHEPRLESRFSENQFQTRKMNPCGIVSCYSSWPAGEYFQG
jgi:hypothetical protein